MNQICLLLLLAVSSEASFIIEVDVAEEMRNVRDYFEDLPNDRPIIGQLSLMTVVDIRVSHRN